MSKREVLAKAKVLSIKQSNRKSWRGAINIIKDSSSTVPGWSGKDDHFLEKDIRHHVVPAKGLPEDVFGTEPVSRALPTCNFNRHKTKDNCMARLCSV